MNTVVVSSKYQVVIPKEIRDSIGLKVGEKLQVISYGSRIELVPIVNISKLKGMYKGIDTKIDREEDRV